MTAVYGLIGGVLWFIYSVYCFERHAELEDEMILYGHSAKTIVNYIITGILSYGIPLGITVAIGSIRSLLTIL